MREAIVTLSDAELEAIGFGGLVAFLRAVGIRDVEMLEKAEDRFDWLERGETLRKMDAQDLAFPDDTFDTVISALSTCTFPDPVAA